MAASFMVVSNLCLGRTSLGETGCLGNPYFLFTYYISTQFFDSPPFFFPTQSVRSPLVSYPSLCSTCMTYSMPCAVIGYQVLPTQPLPREVEDFLRGDRHFKCASAHIPNLPLTKRGILLGSICMPKPPWSKCSTVKKLSTVMELASHWFWNCILKSPTCWYPFVLIIRL